MTSEAQHLTFAGESSQRVAVMALNFYGANYDVIFTADLAPGRKRFLGAKAPRICRFCDRQAPAVSFKSEAHAISGLTGNTTLFTYEECSNCNALFGNLEDDLGKFTLPARMLGQVSGRKGIPGAKIPNARMDMRDGVLRAYIDQESMAITFSDDPDARLVTVSIPLQPYRPRAVYKALLKMALTVAPPNELAPFRLALRWLSSDDIEDNIALNAFGFPCIQTRGAMVYKFPTVRLLRRHPRSSAPYATFILGFGCYTYQIFLPSGEMDEHLRGTDIELQAFPPPQLLLGKSANDWAKFEVAWLSSPSRVVGEVWKADLTYERREGPGTTPTP